MSVVHTAMRLRLANHAPRRAQLAPAAWEVEQEDLLALLPRYQA